MQYHLILYYKISGVYSSMQRGNHERYVTTIITQTTTNHDDILKWKSYPCYWPLVRGIHRSPMNSPHKGEWHGALIFSLIWTNGWANNRDAGQGYETPSRSLWRHCNVMINRERCISLWGTWCIHVYQNNLFVYHCPTRVFNWWAPGRYGSNFDVQFTNLIYRILDKALAWNCPHVNATKCHE